jgi:hypothetical protein
MRGCLYSKSIANPAALRAVDSLQHVVNIGCMRVRAHPGSGRAHGGGHRTPQR